MGAVDGEEIPGEETPGEEIPSEGAVAAERLGVPSTTVVRLVRMAPLEVGGSWLTLS